MLHLPLIGVRMADEVEVYGELYRDGVCVEWNTDLRTEATWAQVDLTVSNPLGAQSYKMIGYHRAQDGIAYHETTSYSSRDNW